MLQKKDLMKFLIDHLLIGLKLTKIISMKYTTILLVFFIFMASCHKDDDTNNQTDENGVITSLSYQWKKSLHLNGTVSNSKFDIPIKYNGNIGIPTTNGDNNRLITLINPNNGDFIWSWDDRYQPETERIGIYYAHQNNNLLTYQTGDRSYCIDLDDGTTQWKFRRDSPFDVRLYPSYGGNFFNSSSFVNNEGYNEQIMTKVEINTGNLTTEVIRANYSGDYINSSNFIGGVTNVTKLATNNNLYALTYAEPSPNWVVNSYLGLYNASTQQWVYERKLMAPSTTNSSAYEPKIYNNKLYAWVGKNIVCHNLDTGEQIWRKSFPQDFLFSGFIIEDDKIIANNEDTYTYCLNPENGNIIWKTESSGTSGRMSYLNGIVYFVGGSTGKLHAIDVSNGEHVWKINASNLGESGSSSFKTNAVYVFEAENGNPAKVIALSHLNAYCFDAYQ
jgi:outer membrane protein assembly factor BamB